MPKDLSKQKTDIDKRIEDLLFQLTNEDKDTDVKKSLQDIRLLRLRERVISLQEKAEEASQSLKDDVAWKVRNRLVVSLISPLVLTARQAYFSGANFKDESEITLWLEENVTQARHVLDFARKLQRLCRWRLREAMLYLFLDEVPTLSPMNAELVETPGFGHPVLVNLKIDPRVNPDDLRSYYRLLCSTIENEKQYPISRREHSDEGLALIGFVLDTQDCDWSQRFQKWKLRYPQYSNHWKSPKSMATSYQRMKQTLLTGLSSRDPRGIKQIESALDELGDFF